MTNTILFFSGILAALILGSRLKINIGLVALAFAFVLGTTAGGLSANGVVALFPVTLFFNFFLATFLFGFAGKNGTLKLLAAHLLYACRSVGWMMGLLFFAVTVIVAAMGAGGSAPFFLSPICFGLAMQAGIASILVPLAVWTGSMVGGSVPWTAGYATNIGQLEIYFDAAASKSYVMNFFTFRAVFYTILYVVLFLVFRGWKAKKLETVSLEKPESFNAKQKKTLAIILFTIVMVIVGSLLQTMIKVSWAAQIGRICSFQFLAALGIVMNIYWKTAEYDRVLKEAVPWDTLLMLSLTGMYMALANALGVVTYMSDVLQNQISPALILPGIVLAMSVLSFFVSGGVIISMMLPLLQVFASASGTSVSMIYCAAQMGLTASSISPFSQGGAAALTGCTDESIRRKLIRQQTILSGVFALVLFLLAILGVFALVE